MHISLKYREYPYKLDPHRLLEVSSMLALKQILRWLGPPWTLSNNNNNNDNNNDNNNEKQEKNKTKEDDDDEEEERQQQCTMNTSVCNRLSSKSFQNF